MKIINEFVKIKIGKKEYEFQNLILDTYLRHMAEVQEDFNRKHWQSPFLSKCFVKFDRKLEFDETSILDTEDFDIQFTMTNNYATVSTNKNEIEYIYELNDDISNYYGNKITAIGFFDYWEETCYACVDLSDYSIEISEGSDISIVRKDTLSTQATFTASYSSVKFPIHLFPSMVEMYIPHPKVTDDFPEYTEYVSAHLESVGLGLNKTTMRKEFQLTDENTEFFGQKIIFRNIFNIENLLDILEPNFRQPSNNLYPIDTKINFTHIFIKYKIYYNRYTYPGSSVFEHVDSGEWYTLSMPINQVGEFDYAIEYERRDDYGI